MQAGTRIKLSSIYIASKLNYRYDRASNGRTTAIFEIAVISFAP